MHKMSHVKHHTARWYKIFQLFQSNLLKHRPQNTQFSVK